MSDETVPQLSRAGGLQGPKRCSRCNEIVPWEKLMEHAEAHLGPTDIIGELAKAARDPYWREHGTD
jgi:hypothetical protein